jgi:peptide deformylase
MHPLPRTQFGNPILRQKAKKLSLEEISTPSFKRLIKEMFFTIQDIGIGLAAPQVGKSIQLAVIDIHPLSHRPDVELFKRVLINPKILEYSREKENGYEGCLSFDELRAETTRSKRVKVSYLDEQGTIHVEWIEGLVAKAFQHEIDHLNGVLYVDHVQDSRTIMTTKEFNKCIRRM